MKKASVLLALSAVLLLGAGCAAKAPTPTSGDTTAPKTATGSEKKPAAPAAATGIPDAPSTGATLGADFPTDLPIFPAAYITSWDVNEKRSYVMFFSEAHTGEEVLNWYEPKLTALGYTKGTLSGDSTEGYSIVYKKADARLNFTTGVPATGTYKTSVTIYRYPIEVK